MFSRVRNKIKELKELKYLAYHDSMTGLLNRNWLYKFCDDIPCKYVYFIDINDLHKVNEKGHIFGDEFIQEIVQELRSKANNEDLIRYAGDEFVLFSNRVNVISTNEKYSVGMSQVNGCLMNAIHLADIDMIKNKNL